MIPHIKGDLVNLYNKDTNGTIVVLFSENKYELHEDLHGTTGSSPII